MGQALDRATKLGPGDDGVRPAPHWPRGGGFNANSRTSPLQVAARAKLPKG